MFDAGLAIFRTDCSGTPFRGALERRVDPS